MYHRLRDAGRISYDSRFQMVDSSVPTSLRVGAIFIPNTSLPIRLPLSTNKKRALKPDDNLRSLCGVALMLIR